MEVNELRNKTRKLEDMIEVLIAEFEEENKVEVATLSLIHVVAIPTSGGWMGTKPDYIVVNVGIGLK